MCVKTSVRKSWFVEKLVGAKVCFCKKWLVQRSVCVKAVEDEDDEDDSLDDEDVKRLYEMTLY